MIDSVRPHDFEAALEEAKVGTAEFNLMLAAMVKTIKELEANLETFAMAVRRAVGEAEGHPIYWTDG